jgi:chromosome condensin MukBEF ATPase and DNA-binding subunit MukB
VSDIESTVRTIESLCSEDAAWSSSDRAFVKHETRTLVATLTTDRDEWKRRYVDMAGTRAEEWKQYVAAEKERETLRTRAEAAEKERDELRQDLNDARDGWERAVEEVRRLDAIEGAAKRMLECMVAFRADRNSDWVSELAAAESALSDSLSDMSNSAALGEPPRETFLDEQGNVRHSNISTANDPSRRGCTCINGNDHAVATTAVVDCSACGEE